MDFNICHCSGRVLQKAQSRLFILPLKASLVTDHPYSSFQIVKQWGRGELLKRSPLTAGLQSTSSLDVRTDHSLRCSPSEMTGRWEIGVCRRKCDLLNYLQGNSGILWKCHYSHYSACGFWPRAAGTLLQGTGRCTGTWCTSMSWLWKTGSSTLHRLHVASTSTSECSTVPPLSVCQLLRFEPSLWQCEGWQCRSVRPFCPDWNISTTLQMGCLRNLRKSNGLFTTFMVPRGWIWMV